MGTDQEPFIIPENQTWEKGEKQPSACKDAPFAIIFISQFIAIGTVAYTYGLSALKKSIADSTINIDDNENLFSADYTGYLYASGATALLSFLLSAFMLRFMIGFAEFLVKFSLLFSVVLSGVFATLAILSGSIAGFVVFIIPFAFGACYARLVWSRIPIATANLVTSLTAIKENFGVTYISYIFVVLGIGWVFVWTLAFIGTYDQTTVCDDQTGQCTVNYYYVFLLLISFYWTQQVLMNTIQVTVAGVVGTWWFVPEEATSCCSTAVTSSFFRSTTYSFGSICFGSLIVAIIEALREMATQARMQREGNEILLCLAQCILNCLESLILYFNKWAYVYVGVYGYGYLDAGKNVKSLFQARGWDVVIADDLVGGVLGLVTFITGLLSGVIALILEAYTDWFVDAGDEAGVIAFILGFLIGLVLSSVMFNVIASGVNATIVLYAEAPAELQSNHPDLSREMRNAYLEAYPALF